MGWRNTGTSRGLRGDAGAAAAGLEEWKAASRAGQSWPFHFGDNLDPSWANEDHTDGDEASHTKGTDPQRPEAIDTHGLMNRWGVAEMHGPMFEWCGDLWHPSSLGGRKAAPRGVTRLLCVISWINDPPNCRAACRCGVHPVDHGPAFGVRPCCGAVELSTTGVWTAAGAIHRRIASGLDAPARSPP